MPWTTPRTWVAGELVKEGDLNEQIRDNMNVLKVALNDDGKIIALDATRLANLSGANLTGVGLLGANSTYTAGTHNFNGGSGTRLRVPVGSNKWAT